MSCRLFAAGSANDVERLLRNHRELTDAELVLNHRYIKAVGAR